MILLNPIVEVLTGTVKDLTAKNAANRPPIGSVLISRHAFRFMADRRDGLFEKRLGRQQIALFAQHSIDQVAVAIDGSVQIAPRAVFIGDIETNELSRSFATTQPQPGFKPSDHPGHDVAR